MLIKYTFFCTDALVNLFCCVIAIYSSMIIFVTALGDGKMSSNKAFNNNIDYYYINSPSKKSMRGNVEHVIVLYPRAKPR